MPESYLFRARAVNSGLFAGGASHPSSQTPPSSPRYVGRKRGTLPALFILAPAQHQAASLRVIHVWRGEGTDCLTVCICALAGVSASLPCLVDVGQVTNKKARPVREDRAFSGLRCRADHSSHRANLFGASIKALDALWHKAKSNFAPNRKLLIIGSLSLRPR